MSRVLRFATVLLSAASVAAQSSTFFDLSEEQRRLAVLSQQLATVVYPENRYDGRDSSRFLTQMPDHVSLIKTIDEPDGGIDAQVFLLSEPGRRPRIVLAFAGTESLPDMGTDLEQQFSRGPMGKQVDRARQLGFEAREIARRFNASWDATGHSLGGLLATVAGAWAGAENIFAFNAAAFGPGTLAALRPEIRQIAVDRTVHFATVGDLVFYGTARLPGAAHLGRAVVTAPPPDLKGIIAPDLAARRPISALERGMDRLARHMAPLNVPLRSAQPMRAIPVGDALRPNTPVWWTTNSRRGGTGSGTSNLEALADMAGGARRIAIAGRGPDVDATFQKLVARLGSGNVMLLGAIDTADRARIASIEGAPDLIIGARGAGPHPVFDLERVLMPVRRAQAISGFLQASAFAMRGARLFAGDLNDGTAAPWKSAAARSSFAKLLSSEPAGELLDRWEDVSDRIDLALAATHDANEFVHGGLRVGNSELLNLVEHCLADVTFRRLISDMPKQLAPGLPRIGASVLMAGKELATAVIEFDPSHTTSVDVLEHALDAVVAGTWFGAGLVATRGNVKVAEAVADLGVARANLARAELAERRDAVYQAFDDWQADQFDAARQGLRLRSLEESFRSRGLDVGSLPQQLRQSADEYMGPLRRLASESRRHPVPVMALRPSERSSNARGFADTEIASRLVASGSKRFVITGPTISGEITQSWMEERYGADNIKRVTRTASRYEVQQIARSFNADLIVQVEPDQPAFKAMAPSFPHRLPAHAVRAPQAPRPPSQPIAPRTGVGGVLLRGRGEVSGEVDRFVDGEFDLLFNDPDGVIDLRRLRMFVTAAWAVYFSDEGPGVSIDPIAPNVDKHLVRYIGLVVNTDLGRVMREADYLMKKWAVGTERPDFDGFRSVDAIEQGLGSNTVGISRRFWFVPDALRFNVAGPALTFESGSMRLRTEVDGSTGRTTRSDQAFADYFTANYFQISEKYPVFGELFEYAQLVYLARYLKDQGVPLAAFLLSNKDMVLTEDSPGTVDELVMASHRRHIEIRGGVDLAPKKEPGRYIVDTAVLRALREVPRSGPATTSEQWTGNPQLVASLSVGDRELTARAADSLTLASADGSAGHLATDIALRNNGDPVLELMRVARPPDENGEFGTGWGVLRPYCIRKHDAKMIDFRNARIPAQIDVVDQVSGESYVLTFSDSRYRIAGYVPTEDTRTSYVGLFLMSDLTYRLVDRIGNEFHFGNDGELREMHLGNKFWIRYRYDYETVTKEFLGGEPYSLEPSGAETVDAGPVTIPARLTVTDSESGRTTAYRYDAERADLVGYRPEEPRQGGSDNRFIAISQGGQFVLEDGGTQIVFDRGGRFEERRHRVLRALEHGDHRVELAYVYEARSPRVSSARLVQKGLSAAAQVVSYDYRDGRLFRVILPGGKERLVSPTPLESPR